ncbi:MAG: thioredoxin domain-containing protein, partial [Bdellovibrionales bacterium]|nr:thioredoxin domain-containing protein [Bdellovibrionales bacterium]
QDIDAFIANRRIPADKINATLKDQVRRFLTGQYIAAQIDNWLELESKKYKISILLAEPEEPRFSAYIDESPARGGKNAAVTIVEYSDFECPYCTRASTTLRALEKQYGDNIKLVYKHLPLVSLHANAQNLALAGVCAQAQGEGYFWQLHDKIFENNRGLTLGRVKDYVKDFGLDMQAFNQCLDSTETA